MRRSKDSDDVGRRIADLLERRRAGLLTAEKLHLAAYIGDPAARALWSQDLPDEAALRAGPLARFFDGVEEAVERSWARALSQRRRKSFAAVVERASREPRLRRLFVRGANAHQMILGWCSRGVGTLGLSLQSGRGESWILTRGRDSRGPFRDLEAGMKEVVASLAPRPRPVWLGRREDLPLDRARRGLLNDALGPEGVLAGLFAWPRPITTRAILALEPRLLSVWEGYWRPDSELKECLAAMRRWLREPDQETERALIIAATPLSEVAVNHDNLRRPPEVAIVSRLICQAPTLDHIRGLDRLRTILSPAEILADMARGLVPWALYDEEPLAD